MGLGCQNKLVGAARRVQRTVFLVQALDLEVVAAVVVGLVEGGYGGEERARGLGQWVEEAAVDYLRRHVPNCEGDNGDQEGRMCHMSEHRGLHRGQLALWCCVSAADRLLEISGSGGPVGAG